MVSWWASKGSSGQREVWESRDSSPHFQVSVLGSQHRPHPPTAHCRPAFAIAFLALTPHTLLAEKMLPVSRDTFLSLLFVVQGVGSKFCLHLNVTQTCPKVSFYPKHRKQKEKKSNCLLSSFLIQYHKYLLSTFYESVTYYYQNQCLKITSTGGLPAAVQWLRLRSSTARDMVLIPGQEIKIPQVAQCGQKEKCQHWISL